MQSNVLQTEMPQEIICHYNSQICVNFSIVEQGLTWLQLAEMCKKFRDCIRDIKRLSSIESKLDEPEKRNTLSKISA